MCAHYPERLPLLVLAGTGPYAILALRFTEVAYATAARTALVSRPAPDALPFRRGLVGLLSHDQFAGTGDPAPPRIFRVDQALVVHQATGRVTVTGDADAAAEVVVPAAVVAELVEAISALGSARAASPSADAAASSVRGAVGAGLAGMDAPALTLIPDAPAESYLDLASQALTDIRDGRYYQINLLRYFRAREAIGRRWLAGRIDRFGGPQAALFDLADLSVAWFSPERFLRLTPTPAGLVAEAWPIKGTSPRDADPVRDAAAARDLVTSRKDLAELHMIVDLMRNDLHRVALRGAVTVPETARLVSVPSVHHLEAHVAARLRPDLTLGELLASVCPAGSITGAPKREVMTAIRAYEGRPRRYFMGHAFYLDEGGGLDSSILIRTLVREGAATRENAYAFAAGSGIVIASDPQSERCEIDAKCRVVTET